MWLRWAPPILKTVALTGRGIEALAHHIESHQQFLTESGQGEARRQAFTAAMRHFERASIRWSLRCLIVKQEA